MLRENRPAAQTTHHAMGTVMVHKAFGSYAEESLEAVCGEVVRLEGLLSRFIPDSDISRVNRSAGVQSEKVSFDTYAVLSGAVEFSRKFPGCFAVTIAPLVALWNEAKELLSQPDDSAIRRVLGLVDDRDLILDPNEMIAGLRKQGQALDLGGIGKGYTGDRILEVFREYGITSAFSNLGGNVVTLGSKPDGSPWRVGIQHPRQEGRIIGSVAAVNQAVVTSGDYQRSYIDRKGRRRHHILDPKTGYPSDSGLISVTIVSANSMEADVLSTVLFVAGMEQGLELLRECPQSEAVLIDADLRVFVTQGLKYRFQADQGIEVTYID